jgi:hypothetical protein
VEPASLTAYTTFASNEFANLSHSRHFGAHYTWQWKDVPPSTSGGKAWAIFTLLAERFKEPIGLSDQSLG